MSIKLLLALGLAAFTCSAANAQSMTLGRGQMMYISPNGQVTTTSVPTDAKMVKSMHRGMHGMSRGMVIWMDQAGRMHVTESYIAIQDLGFREHQ